MKNLLLETNFVLKRTDNVKYVKEEDVSVKTAKKWSNLDIKNDDSFDYFTEHYIRNTATVGKTKEMRQTFSMNFQSKLKIYLNKHGKKTLAFGIKDG